MSLRYMVAAFQARIGHPGKKLLLLKLADFANDEGICWPSKKRLEEDTELSRASITRYIAELESEGWIKREKRVQDGVCLPSIFRLVGLLELASGVGSGRAQGWAQPEPLTDHIEPTIEPQQHAPAPARVYAREDDPPPPAPAAAPQQGKARRRRESGVVTWTQGDVAETERIESAHCADDISQAVREIEGDGLEPVPGRVLQALEKLARRRQAEQAVVRRMAAVPPPPDPEAAARGWAIISKIRARNRGDHEACL